MRWLRFFEVEKGQIYRRKRGLVMMLTTCIVAAVGSFMLVMLGGMGTPAFGETDSLPPTHAEVIYGPHERNVLDFWQAKSETPTALAIYIHGGGFRNGSKDGLVRREGGRKIVRRLLEAGISVAAINYRLVPKVPLPAAHHDGRRALQFLRSRAGDWNIDPERVGAWGGSAGAQICTYLAFHDEMGDPDSADPVERESTRLSCVVTSGGQTTMDRDWWLQWVPGYDKPHRDFFGDFNVQTQEAYLEKVRDVSALSLISADDPPLFMSYRMAPDDPVPAENAQGWKVHHVIFGIKLKEKMDALGVEAVLNYPGATPAYKSGTDFFIRKLSGK